MSMGRYAVAVLFVCALAMAGTARAQFESENVSLYARLSLSDLGSSGGNDCWGYVSKSGREYALMGLSTKTAVVEITDPSDPVIIGSVSHSPSLSDIKVYRDHAYVSNGSGGGIDVIDLSDVDNGNVTLVQRFTGGGLQRVHNIAINTDSGHLYLAVGNINGGAMVAYDLSTPSDPVEVGRYAGNRSHDLTVITYDTGPYAGREIAFSASEDRGLEIVDVTDKSDMRLLSRLTYSCTGYAHQCWPSADRRYLYLGDEFDEFSCGHSTRTIILNIEDLSDPIVVNTVTTGRPAIDHNQYVRDGYLFQANYTSGMWVYDLNASTTDPPVVGYFDTFPGGDPIDFDGAWSVFPFFPSGTVIVSDMARGLFILDVSEVTGGGGVPCEDVKRLRGKCRLNGRVVGKVRMTDTSHDGETVVIAIDGTNFEVEISGRRAVVKNCCFTGAHTVSLVEPADCKAPVEVACP